MNNPELGKFAPSDAVRDAVHFAIAPVVAAHDLAPGQHVGLSNFGQAETSPAPIGIVDPFLTTSKVIKGERYPCKPEIFAATYEPATGETQAS